MGKEMIVDTEYAGYVFVGWAAGRFKTVIWYKKSRHLQLTEKVFKNGTGTEEVREGI